MATTKVVGTRKPSLQVKHGKDEQDVEPFATKYSCASHQVTYYVPANKRGKNCPVCALEVETDELRSALAKLSNENAMLLHRNERMSAELDIGTAMKSAIEMLNDEDKFWLKEQLYAFKLDKSVVLKVTHGAAAGKTTRRRDARTPNGFIAMKRKGDPEAHSCTSIGGLALARYFEEACTTYGATQAMALMVKTLWEFLPGARP